MKRGQLSEREKRFLGLPYLGSKIVKDKHVSPTYSDKPNRSKWRWPTVISPEQAAFIKSRLNAASCHADRHIRGNAEVEEQAAKSTWSAPPKGGSKDSQNAEKVVDNGSPLGLVRPRLLSYPAPEMACGSASATSDV